jgi:hypothetical protein
VLIQALSLIPSSASAATPDFHRDVAPILYRHCAECHHQGEVAPFSLLTYADAGPRAKSIAAVVAARTMPPWEPESGYGEFAHARRLTVAEIQTIQRWAANNAPEGDPAHGAQPPHYEAGDWKLGKPDLVVTLPEPYAVAPEQADQYQCFAIPLNLPRDRYVRALEFRPQNRRVVHHALFFTGHAPSSNYSCFGTPGFVPASALGGWSPGMGPIDFPEGTAGVLRGRSDLVLQLHFHATGKPEREQSSIAFYFTDTPPVKKIMDAGLTSKRIDIPPGDSHYKVTDHFTLPIDVSAIGVIPHAHYICKEMRGWAILPDGSKKWLLYIKDWDFNWQEQYRYARPIHLPADTRLEMEFIYDNSDGNIRNPNSPPQRVMWGGSTTDEMAGLHVQVIPDNMDEMPILGQALWGKVMRSVGGEFFRMTK